MPGTANLTPICGGYHVTDELVKKVKKEGILLAHMKEAGIVNTPSALEQLAVTVALKEGWV